MTYLVATEMTTMMAGFVCDVYLAGLGIQGGPREGKKRRRERKKPVLLLEDGQALSSSSVEVELWSLCILMSWSLKLCMLVVSC